MVALVAVAAGSTFATLQVADYQSTPIAKSGAFLHGHVTAKVLDEQNNILAYRQADNAIVKDGMGIIANQVFEVDAGNMSSGTVRYMSIGNGSAAPAWNDFNLTSDLLDIPATNGCLRLDSTVTNDTAINIGGFAAVNITAVAEFNGAQCASNDIQEAGIWNHPTHGQGELFARNTFGNVDLTTSDRLELTWLFTFTDQ